MIYSNPAVVLLLEDEGLIALDIEYSLEGAGFSVTTLASRQAAEDWLEGNEPQLAIIDVLLQDGPSYRVAEMLISRRIPFLVHSGDLAQVYEGTPLSQGEWITKPANTGDIADWARRTVQVRQGEDQSVSSPGS
jgi:DNA-binding response OmpR family regulator